MIEARVIARKEQQQPHCPQWVGPPIVNQDTLQLIELFLSVAAVASLVAVVVVDDANAVGVAAIVVVAFVVAVSSCCWCCCCCCCCCCCVELLQLL